jgi:hypothetical protein
MFGKSLKRHIREFSQYVARKEFEETSEGIIFPKANAIMRGSYTHWVNDDMSTLLVDHNTIPLEGLNHVLDVLMVTGWLTANAPIWYMALYGNAYTPTAALTASNFTTTAGEITSPTEGYDEANRVVWAGDTVDLVEAEVTNDTVPSLFTIATAGTLAVNGAALLSANTKGSQSGKLISAGRFAATRNLSDTDEFNCKYKVDVDAA